METTGYTFDQLYTALLGAVPEIGPLVETEFGADYDLKKESPGAYPIFEDVVQKALFKSLDDPKDSTDLKRLFDFFETMALSNDGNVTDVLRIAILEPLVYNAKYYERSRNFMGKRTTEYALWEEGRQKRQKVPPKILV